MTTLYAISKNGLQPVQRATLESEAMLEDWIFEDPSIMGLDVLVIGRQVTTYNQGRIDILAMERNGDLVIIELKRHDTPRDVVGQVLDYASWVADLTTRQIHDIAGNKLERSLVNAYRERFDAPLPDNLNGDHSMVIVASEFDASSKRIVEYLAEHHGLKINSAFFAVFERDGEKLLATEWLMDQQEVVERAESRTRAPWTGYYYVNGGHMPDYRSWEDMKKYGFISAGGGEAYTNELDRLGKGAPIYVYQKQRGYVGFGVVLAPKVMAKDFRFSDGKSLFDVELANSNLLHDYEDSEKSEYVVAVEWKEAVSIEDAKTFRGVFANQHIVCQLTQPATLEFLAREFGTL